MLTDSRNEMEKVFDLLSQKRLEAEDDPELSELYNQASRHFTAATEYRQDARSEYVEYELEQVRETLGLFEGSRWLTKRD